MGENALRDLALGRIGSGTELRGAARRLGKFLDAMDNHQLHHGIISRIHLSISGENIGKIDINVETAMKSELWDALQQLRQALENKSGELLESGEKMLLQANQLEEK